MMLRTLSRSGVIALFGTALSLPAQAMFAYKTVDEFKPLGAFSSVEAFEAHYEEYIQICLDNTGGGSAAIPCFIGSELWDRELNIYYSRLMSRLDSEAKTQLRESQRAWLKMRDTTIDFNSGLMDRTYTLEGTMYQAMRAGDVDDTFTPIVKTRALTLKRWSEAIEPKAAVNSPDFVKKHVGFWGGYSKNIYSIYGDMRFDGERLSFDLKGEFSYEVIADKGNYIFVKLDRALDCKTPYVRLGPVRNDGRGTQMEFSLTPIDKLDAALATDFHKFSASNVKHTCSWGLYVRYEL